MIARLWRIALALATFASLLLAAGAGTNWH
jgi:hypothetical protein